jgi:DNA ligase 1
MKPILFSALAETLDRLGQTASSSRMIAILAEFFSRISPGEARMAVYLLRGRVAPDFQATQFGMAEKSVIRALAMAGKVPPSRVETAFRKSGDLGDAAAALAGRKEGTGLSLPDVFERLRVIALTSGAGSQEAKVRQLTDLLARCSKPEARYIVRIVLGTLRIGVGEMTLLYALSKARTGTKGSKRVVEDAYNVLSDLGEVAERAVRSGVESLKRARPVVGKPVRMMLVQRIRDLADVAGHIRGPVHVEYKYDGERVQAHVKKDGTVVLFSRRLEEITREYPDVAEAARTALRVREAIVEGEVVAVDPRSGKLRDFQTLMQRRRKYEVEAYSRSIPVKYFVFDILLLEGESLLNRPLSERKEILSRYLAGGERIAIATYTILEARDRDQIEGFFSRAVAWGAEGVVIKDANSRYEAGKRGWHWVKYKKEYREGLADTFDLVVVGAVHGKGSRAGSYGSLLLAAFDPTTNRYESFTKVGAGFKAEDLDRLPGILRPYRRAEKHRLVETGLKADVWFDPEAVVEVTGAQITVSPVHTVAQEKIRDGGLALRFPRFVHWRKDKAPEQATTVQEIYDLYRRLPRR